MKIDWSYDALSRLVEEIRDADPTPANGVDNFGTQEAGDYTDTYAFNLAGNRTRRVLDHFDAAKDETIAYAYNERDQLMSEDSTIAANDKSYAYDANGSTTQVTKDGVSTYYLWDPRNRLKGISLDNDGTSTDAGETTYTYDHAGVRVAQSTVGGPLAPQVNEFHRMKKQNRARFRSHAVGVCAQVRISDGVGPAVRPRPAPPATGSRVREPVRR